MRQRLFSAVSIGALLCFLAADAVSQTRSSEVVKSELYRLKTDAMRGLETRPRIVTVTIRDSRGPDRDGISTSSRLEYLSDDEMRYTKEVEKGRVKDTFEYILKDDFEFTRENKDRWVKRPRQENIRVPEPEVPAGSQSCRVWTMGSFITFVNSTPVTAFVETDYLNYRFGISFRRHATYIAGDGSLFGEDITEEYSPDDVRSLEPRGIVYQYAIRYDYNVQQLRISAP